MKRSIISLKGTLVGHDYRMETERLSLTIRNEHGEDLTVPGKVRHGRYYSLNERLNESAGKVISIGYDGKLGKGEFIGLGVSI